MFRIGFFGDGDWAVGSLNALRVIQGIEISFICVRLQPSSPELECMALQSRIPLLKFKNINDESSVREIKSFECSLLVSMSYDQIFSKTVIDLCELGIINCHAGMLPFYRGRNVLNWALINDEKYFGVTVHFVDEGIDTGDIILQRKFFITDQDEYSSILKRAIAVCPKLVAEAVVRFSKGDIQAIPQDQIHPTGFYCSKRLEGDEIINWNQTSREVFNFVRALNDPGPVAQTYLRGDLVKIYKVRECESAPYYKGIAGSILAKSSNGFFVKTGDSFVEVISWCEFGKKLFVGGRLVGC